MDIYLCEQKWACLQLKQLLDGNTITLMNVKIFESPGNYYIDNPLNNSITLVPSFEHRGDGGHVMIPVNSIKVTHADEWNGEQERIVAIDAGDFAPDFEYNKYYDGEKFLKIVPNYKNIDCVLRISNDVRISILKAWSKDI